MCRRYAIGVSATAQTGHDVESILINWGDHVLGKVSMPNNALIDLLSFPCSAGFAKLVVLASRKDFPDHSAADTCLKHSVIIADISCKEPR